MEELLSFALLERFLKLKKNSINRKFPQKEQLPKPSQIKVKTPPGVSSS
jgi:hypothetical protein